MVLRNVRLLIENRIATVTLDRPERRNAFDHGMIEGLSQVLRTVDEHPDVGCVVLTGAGTAFCAGADMGVVRTALDSPAQAARIDLRDVHRVTLALWDLAKPVIAAVNGPAIAAGCDLALACDIRIAAVSARFGEVYARLGIIPGNGATYLLPRIVGLAKACELIFTNEVIDAQEALRIGLVTRVVGDAELLPAAYELAGKIACGPPLALREARRAMHRDLNRGIRPAFEEIRRIFEVLRQTEDHAEGVLALGERRQPRFRGR